MILGYLRVSTEDQAADGRTSLAEQERILRGLAMMKGAHSFDVAMFSDPGVSGSVPLAERPGGAELLSTAKKGDSVVAVKLDRLFRSASDALNVADDFKRKGIDLILTDMGNDPVTGNGSARLFFTLLAAVAEFERDRITERIASGKRAKKASGGHTGGIPPYGYQTVGHGRQAILEPLEAEQEVIRLVRELGRELGSPYRITKELSERGMRNRAGGEFQVVQVQRMLARSV